MTAKLAPAVLARLIAAILAVGLLVVGLQAAGGNQRQITVTATFSRAGLNVRPGYEVRVRGMPVGTITSISVDHHDFSALYTLKLDGDVAVARDTHANLVPKTFFGDKYVELDPAEPGQALLRSGDHIDRVHTRPPTEVQELFDQVTPLLEALDPPRFGAALASISQGLAGEGDNLRRLTEGSTAAMEQLSAHQDDLRTLLTKVPGVAGTFAERSQDLATAADDLGQVAQVLAKDEPALGPLLVQNAKLANQAAELLVDEPARLGRIVPDMVDVIALTVQQPGRIAKLAKSMRFNLRGVANIMGSGWIQTRVTNTFILNWGTIYDAPGSYGDYNGGTGVTPDVNVNGMPNRNAPIDLSPSQKAAADTGLDRLLGPLAGSGA